MKQEGATLVFVITAHTMVILNIVTAIGLRELKIETDLVALQNQDLSDATTVSRCDQIRFMWSRPQLCLHY